MSVGSFSACIIVRACFDSPTEKMFSFIYKLVYRYESHHQNTISCIKGKDVGFGCMTKSGGKASTTLHFIFLYSFNLFPARKNVETQFTSNNEEHHVAAHRGSAVAASRSHFFTEFSGNTPTPCLPFLSVGRIVRAALSLVQVSDA
jgi:hypothetical protein